MVRKERLELSRREALEPKSSVSTNSTTSAQLDFPKRDNRELVATARFELATPSLWVMCSNQLSYVAFHTSLPSQEVARIMRIWLATVNPFFTNFF